VALLVAGLLGLGVLYFSRRPPCSTWLPWLGGLVAYAVFSTLVPRMPLASRESALSLVAISIAGGALVWAACERHKSKHDGFVGLAILAAILAIAVLLQNFAVDLKALAGVTAPHALSGWNRKYHETWVLIMLWGSVASLPTRWRWSLHIGVGLSLLTLGALFSGTSASVKLIGSLSLLLFWGFWKAPRVVTRAAGWAILVAFLAPLLIAPVIPKILGSGLASYEPTQRPFYAKVMPRLLIWQYWQDRVVERPWLGWGLGASEALGGRRERVENALSIEVPDQWDDRLALPGGHPHGLPFLIWLELGAVGAVCAGMAFRRLLLELGNGAGALRQAALRTMLLCLLLIFLVNYPAWHPVMLAIWVATALIAASVTCLGGEPPPASLASVVDA
jgi:hypothetical protein